MKAKSTAVSSLQTRLRVRLRGEVALGPGKVELLEWIEKTGSITKAARQIGMSYMRAWTLIRTMNECFKEPLVLAARGGRQGGGSAKLSEAGHKALELYRQMDAQCLEAAQANWKQLRKLLRR